MAEWKSRVGKLALVLIVALVAGCPQDLTPELSATPGAVNFGSAQATQNIVVANRGGGTLEWTAREVTRSDVDSPWLPGEVPWLTLGATEGSITDELANIELAADRAGLTAGIHTNSGVEITSNGGTAVIPVTVAVEASLQVSPARINLSATDTSAGFSIGNTGSVPLNWAASYLTDAADPDTAGPFPAGFNLSPESGTLAAQATEALVLTFPAGRSSFGVLISSSSGTQTIAFSVGASLGGLVVNPSTLRVSLADGAGADAAQPPSTLTLQNTGATAVAWTISLHDSLAPETAPPLAANPILGSTAAGAASEVEVRITDPSAIIQSEGRYELVVRSGSAFQVVPIVIDVLPVPEIVIAHAPDVNLLQPPVVPRTLLDFGTDTIQQQFWIVNTGSADSRLYFEIQHDDQGEADPLIASVTPLQGNTNGSDQDYFLGAQELYADGVPVTVTINRANLVDDVETRTITVRAVNSDFSSTIPAVDVATIQVRVEKQPFVITGALNRSRPPNLLRYVLSNRDDLGQIVPLQTMAERERVDYEIFEDEVALDLDETSQFLTYDYRGDVVLLLDFTGSMYRAGTSGENALNPGDAILIMREAAKAFIQDMPSNFRMQLMYFSDRTSENRVIQPFTSDRALLVDKLDKFSLSPALYGNSDVYDALGAAMAALAAEAPATTLPFDDADLRAVVFITDGHDTVSGISLSDVESRADETRARLYPVTYSPNGSPVNLADMLSLADASGGYLYNAGTVRDLQNVLGTQSNMRLIAQAGNVGNTASFTIENLSPQAIAFEVEEDGDSPWLGSFNESRGLIQGNGSREIAVTLNPAGLEEDSVVEGTINVSAGNGRGQVVAQFRVAGGNTLTDVSTVVRDESGTIWAEFNNQSVVTYMTAKEQAFTYLLSGRYRKPNDRIIEGAFERDGSFLVGDPTVGQVSLKTSGIFEDRTTVDPDLRFRAEAFVYADYVPRNVTSFAMRFFLLSPDDVSVESQALLNGIEMNVEIAADGILADDNVGTADWRLISEGEGRFRLITDEENYLPVASFGNLLKITFTNLDEYVATFGTGVRQPEFLLAMRIDNQKYVSPQSERQPSTTRYFLYPGGLANPERVLSLELNRPDLAPPAQETAFLAGLAGFDPEAPDAFDTDGDTFPNFNDPAPLDSRFPVKFVIPNPFEVGAAIEEFTLTVRNTTLDRFNWSLMSATARRLLDSFAAADSNSDNSLSVSEIMNFAPEISVNEIESLDNDGDERIDVAELSAVTLPDWLPVNSIRYGPDHATEPLSTLLPGESETVHFVVDRTGQTPGTTSTTLVVFNISNTEYAFFVPEPVPVTLVTNP